LTVKKNAHLNFYNSYSTYDLGIADTQPSSYGYFQLTGEVQEETLYDLIYYPGSGQIIQVVRRSPVTSRLSNLQRHLLSTKDKVSEVVEPATPNFIYP
jgi:hypothetical protein